MPYLFKNKYIIIICFLSFLLGIVVDSLVGERAQSFIQTRVLNQRIKNENSALNIAEKPSINIDLFYEAYKQASENYYGFDTISEKDMVSGMIKGFINSF